MPTVTIISPTSGSTVPPNFTATGTVTGISGPIPTPPPLTVCIEIDGVKTWATSVTMDDAGNWTANFSGVPAGTRGKIKATWTPTGEYDTVTPITVQ
jgi:hypothetical protein